jgi:Zn-dependent protease with chaperone function
MSTAAGLLLYAAALIWLGRPVLARITGGGMNPRLGVAAWLTAIGCVVAGWVGALGALLVDALNNLTNGTALTLCFGALRIADRFAVSGPLGSLVLGALIAAALLVTTVVGRRILCDARQRRFRSHEHARAARIIGQPTDTSDVVVIQSHEPAAYCVAGRPAVIVVTSAALDRLDESQLVAVLDHEHAHINGRHHQLLLVLRACAACLSRLPIFAASADAVSRLLEMCADDASARRHGPHPLLCGLIALADRPPVAAHAHPGAARPGVSA